VPALGDAVAAAATATAGGEGDGGGGGGRPSEAPRLLAAIAGHTGAVLAVRFTPDGRRLVSASDDRRIHVHEWRGAGAVVGLPSLGAQPSVEAWTTVQRLSGHESDVVDVTVSRDGRWLASCSLDGTVLVWEAVTASAAPSTTTQYRRAARLADHDSAVKGVAFDPASLILATQSDDGYVRLWRHSGGGSGTGGGSSSGSGGDWECTHKVPVKTQDTFFTRLGCVPAGPGQRDQPLFHTHTHTHTHLCHGCVGAWVRRLRGSPGGCRTGACWCTARLWRAAS
jgi:hypothetical protein